MFTSLIERKLAAARSVLIAGAGGGYDVVCGVPIAMALQARGVDVHFASLASTPLRDIEHAVWHTDFLVEVGPDSERPSYFPEGWLARWLREHSEIAPTIWCFEATGAGPLYAGYEYLAKRLAIDAVVVVDGGVDSLLRGDEYALGSPLEDALSLAAAHLLDIPCKALVATAFGAERLDRISHAQALARIADLTRVGSFWGAEAAVPGTPDGDALQSAIAYILANQPDMHQSVVCGSLRSALAGAFGDQPVVAAAAGTPPWISPLMLLYWWFDLDEVASQNLYLPRLIPTRTFPEAAERLGEFVRTRPKRGWESIPI